MSFLVSNKLTQLALGFDIFNIFTCFCHKLEQTISIHSSCFFEILYQLKDIIAAKKLIGDYIFYVGFGLN